MRYLLAVAMLLLASPGWAAITYIGQAENSAVNCGSITLTLPGPPQTNDIVIVALAAGDNDNVNPDLAMTTAGYTELADLFSDDVDEANLGVFCKRMGGTPDTTAVTAACGLGSDSSSAAVAMVFRGVSRSGNCGEDVVTTSTSGLSTMHPNPPSIDWSTANTWTVIAGASGHVLGGAGTYTFPTGYTTDAVDRGSDDTFDCTVGMGYDSTPAADPEDPGTMTHSGSDSADYAWAAATIALAEYIAPACELSIALMGVGCR